MRLGILCGGGPAPGMNSVISAATIEARNSGWDVVGILDGFSHLIEADASHVQSLDIADVSRIHQTGGSILYTSRANPTVRDESAADPDWRLHNALKALTELQVDALVTIGGDDTAFGAAQLARAARASGERAPRRARAEDHRQRPAAARRDADVRVPDRAARRHRAREQPDDRRHDHQALVLRGGDGPVGRPPRARHREGRRHDGRGHRRGVPRRTRSRLAHVADILETTLLKRIAHGRPFGVAIIAEGLSLRFSDEDLLEVAPDLERDEYGNVRLAEVHLHRVLAEVVTKRLKERGQKASIVAKNIGYELRCAPPIPFDIAYTRDLGFGAVEYLRQTAGAGGGDPGAMITIQEDHMVPLPFDALTDPATGKTRVRQVDLSSNSYRVAKEYMIRLEREDLDDPGKLGPIAAAANVTPEEFRDRFGYLVESPGSGA